MPAASAKESQAPTPQPYRHLEGIDWTFSRANTRYGVHAIHPYPAKFIPQVPRHLIQALHPGDETAILDPFCGSGTTLVEASLAGHAAVGIDLSPLACLISKVKSTPLRVSLTAAAEQVVARAEPGSAQIPDIPRIEHWFSRDVQLALSALVKSIELELEEETRDALRIALSSIIVRVSRQESDTRYAAIDKQVTYDDVRELFLRSSARIHEALSETWSSLFPPPKPVLLNRNVLDEDLPALLPPVSLVVTSPPYPNAYEYWLYHKYRMYWLGMDPIEVRTHEIGARPKYFRKNPETATDFERQMEVVFSNLRNSMIAGGHACFQIGNSRIHGEVVDSAALLVRAAGTAGFSPVVTLERSIPLSRKAFNPANSRIRDEKILILRLEGK